MIKRRYLFLSIIIGIGIIHLTGCRSGSESNPVENTVISDMDSIENRMAEVEEDTAMLPEESQSEVEEEPEQEPKQEESEDEADDTPREIPQLPGSGSSLEDFVPEGWEPLDSVTLDFNEDGINDYVGVLEKILNDVEEDWGVYRSEPRILFAIASDGTDGYRLDFQDINLIRTRGEGGVFGDPYLPLTAEGTSFTTHAYGGSAWRWSEDYTYTYREGIWRLTLSEYIYGYGDYITSYSKDDWESGVGIRKERSSEFDDMEEHWELGDYGESGEYDVEYELSLDEPLTLEQASKRWWLAPDRVTDWEVTAIIFAADVELSEDKVRLPDETSWIYYCDENCALYTFNPSPDADKGFDYLAMYCWENKVLSVLAEEDSRIDDTEIYNGKIYYSTEIVENIAYKTMQDGEEQIVEEEDTVGVRLNRVELDGTGKETVFEYRYPGTEQEIVESKVPYLALIYEISGDEIIMEVYIGDEPHPVYRMNTDGSGQKKIGQIPKEK